MSSIRFGIRDLLWAMVVVPISLGCGWGWLDAHVSALSWKQEAELCSETIREQNARILELESNLRQKSR